MINVVFDFETRSRCSLKHTNNYKYAAHPSTEVLCASYSVDGGSVELWTPGTEFPFADVWPEVTLEAFNNEFELNIWNGVCVPKYGWPELSPKQVSCLQARAAYAGLPRKLETVAKNIGLHKQGKDPVGHRIMVALAKPMRGKLKGCEIHGGKFDETPAKHRSNERYCLQDTHVEKIVGRICPALPKREQILWRAHERINRRGVPIDLAFAKNAAELVQRENDRLNAQLMDFAGIKSHNCLTKGKSGWKWLKSRGFPAHDLTEQTLDFALEGGLGELDPLVIEALNIRKLCRDSSASKFAAMVCHADADSRCRGAHVFYKAGPGRFAGAGVNFLNLRRLSKKEIPAQLELADKISTATDLDALHEELQATAKGTVPTLGKLPRLAVCAGPGKKLVVRDYAAIEMRILHWMADDEIVMKELRDFDAGIGADPYKIAAAMILRKKVADIDDDMRQFGKLYRLSCGYLTGAGKLQGTAEDTYGITITQEQSKNIVQLYRRSNPKVVKLWYAIGDAVIAAVDGRPTDVGPASYYMKGGALCCRLPSGREMKYWAPAIVEGSFGPELEAIDQRSGARRPVSLPVLVENQDQAIGRDLLRETLITCESENLPTVLHVYDEGVLEVDEDDTESGTRLQQIMSTTPRWAAGLPIAASGDEHRRYIK